MPSVTRASTTNRPSRGERRGDIERRLLEATDRLMADGSTFTELSVDRLASDAGMSRRTFYVYFQDKADLLRCLAQQVFVEQEAAMRRAWEGTGRTYEDLVDAMSDIVASYRRHQALLRAIVETSGYDADVGGAYHGLMDRATSVVEAVIDSAKAEGGIRQSLHSYETAAALTWMVERACHQILPTSAPSDVDHRVADSLAQIAWTSLYGVPPPAPAHR